MAETEDKQEQENTRLQEEENRDFPQAQGDVIGRDVEPNNTDLFVPMAKLVPVIKNGAKYFAVWMVLFLGVCIIPISFQVGEKTVGNIDHANQTSTGWGKRRRKMERSLSENKAEYKQELTQVMKQRNNLLRKFKCKIRALVVEIEGKSKLTTSVKNRLTKFYRENRILRINILQMRENLDRQRQQNKNVIERLENLHMHTRIEGDENTYTN